MKNIPDEGKVIDLAAGESIVYQAGNDYHFTHSLEQTHWAVELIEDLKAKILVND